MQNPGPEGPTSYQAPAAQPPRRSSPWVWWVGGCGGCGCIAVVAIIGLTLSAFRTHKQPPPVAYVGQWAGQDGTALEIASDGTASYRKGANSISGGGAVINERGRTLRVGLGPFRKTWSITAPPHEVAGSSVMTLDGITFRKGGDIGAGGATEGATGGLSVPSEPELKELTTQTLLRFDHAVQTGDFADFIQQGAASFRAQVTPARLAESSRQVRGGHVDANAIRSAPEHFEPTPTIDKSGLLDVAGYYDTTPRRVRFHMWYAREGSSWKLMEIQVSTR